jgi:integrase
MSLTALLPHRLKTTRFESGVRRAFLVDEDGVPEPYSTLYVTMQVRNASKSVATQKSVLNAVNVLFAHAVKARIDLVARFKAGQLLDSLECEALRRSVQANYGPEAKRQAVVVALGRGKRGHVRSVRPVANGTQYQRFSYIARYLAWLGGELAGESGDGRAAAIAAMKDNILALRPDVPSSGNEHDANAFTREDDALLRQLVTTGSPQNPFTPLVQLRNELGVDLMRLLGKRRGEVLNIRVRDIDFARRQIDIVRRADDPDDHRVNQPLVKTRAHTIPIGDHLFQLINRYLVERRNVPGATKQPYLLVTHKSGPTQGRAMTIEALKEVFRAIKRAEPRLSHLHPHLLRHFNSDEIANAQLSEPPGAAGREQHRRQRNYLAGRAPESAMDAHYTQRETERQATAASLRLQEDLSKVTKRAVRGPSKEGKGQ